MSRRWNRTKIWMTAFVAAGGILGNSVMLGAQERDVTVYLGDEESAKQNSTITAPEKHTKEEILKFYLSHPYDERKSVTYQEDPLFSSSYRAGKLSKESITDGLNALNFVRYIAGIPADVAISEVFENFAQTGSVVMAKNDELSHNPVNKNNIPEEFFKVGYLGTSKSNIGLGYANISASIINGYMDDGDNSNIDRIGHRRWILNPSMQYTGFGYCSDKRSFTALYAFDNSRINVQADYVAWPATVMPYELMKGPWSISLSSLTGGKFLTTEANKQNIKVTIKNITTGKEETFDSSTNQTAGQVPYFNVDTGSYGMGAAIIWKPSITISANDQVQVQVTGLEDSSGKAAEISYTVEFFSLEEAVKKTVEAPKANLKEDIYSSNKEVMLSSSTSGATIYYTTDGSTPTTSSQKYVQNAKILLTGEAGESKTIVIKAIAVKDGMNDSAVSSFTYKIEIPAPSYQVLVNNGKGTGRYQKGSLVTVTANVPSVGRKFKGWKVESGEVVLADSSSATTTFTMTGGNVTITAEYEQAVIDPSAPAYTVTVENGTVTNKTQTGTYTVGMVVAIQADRPKSGMQFDYWHVVSGSAVLANSDSSLTRFVMPEEEVKVEAVYKKASTNSSSSRPSGSGSSNSSGPGAGTQVYWQGVLNNGTEKSFQKGNGALAVNEWVKDQNVWYYAGADAKLKTGWLQTGGKWYYLAGNCAMTTGWQLVNGKWYFLDTINGDMKTGWQRVNGKWYYLDPVNGDMRAGWQLVNGKWYYLDPVNGDMKASWQLVNGKWYYLDPVNGDMKIDWQLVNGKWYYLDPKNGDMKIDWQQVRGKWYYLDPKNGDCLMNTITPDGYRVDENGAWVY